VSTLLICDAEVLVTMDATRREIRGGSVLVRDATMEAVGTRAEIQAWIAADPARRTPSRTVDARVCVVTPGLVNCHHHLFQSRTGRAGLSHGTLFPRLER
jgi:8-oxoguanine deaminase